MASRTTEMPAASDVPASDKARLTFAIEMSTKSIDRLDREIATLRCDARSDCRLLSGAIIASTLALAGLIARSAHWI